MFLLISKPTLCNRTGYRNVLCTVGYGCATIFQAACHPQLGCYSRNEQCIMISIEYDMKSKDRHIFARFSTGWFIIVTTRLITRLGTV